MTAIALQSPLPLFPGLDGLPLSGGSVYFGQPNQDPRQYPIEVFFDQGMTIVASQPLRTTVGFIYRNGAPAAIWISGSCSVLVLDPGGRQVYYLAEWVGGTANTFFFTQAGTGAVSRTAQEKMREHVSILDFIPVAEHAAIKARTSNYDCYADIMEAINSVTYPTQGTYYTPAPAIYFPIGKYIVNSTLDLKKTVRLYGENSGLQPGIGSELKFPAGKTGITVNHFNTLAGGTEAVPTTSAAGTILEGLRLVGGGGATAHGIWLRARALVKNVYVEGFSGNGIHVRAAAGFGGDLEGNANNFRVEGGSSVSNTGHGIFVQGADANSGIVSAWDSTSNGGWGFYDTSFLGNTYIGCHTDANTLGGYKSDNANARNMFINCYSEGGQPTNSVLNPSMVLGGLHSPGFGVSDPWIENSGGLKAPSWSLKSTDQLCTIGFGQGSAVNDFMSISRSGNDPWTLQHANGRVYWDWANSNNQFFTFYDKTDANVANGYARDVASIFTDGPPVGLGFGYMDGNMRLRTTSTVIPSSGTSLLGDIYWHGSPAAGGKAGWICTTGGTNGSTAVLKPFGPIDV